MKKHGITISKQKKIRACNPMNKNGISADQNIREQSIRMSGKKINCFW
jgi:hypothetical protein